MPALPPFSQTLGAGESFNYCHYDLEISACSAAVSICIERKEVEGEKGEREGMKTNIPSPKPQITSLCVTVECDAKRKTGNFEIHISCKKI